MKRLRPLVILAALSGCAGSPAPRPVEPAAASRLERLFPLGVGNSWTYRTRYGGRSEENSVRIERREGGFFVDDRQGRLAFDGDGLRDERRYLLLAPLEKGQRWESTLPDGKRERYEVVRTDARVEVPAGRFDDVVVVRGVTAIEEGTDLELEWCYAPGVGLVKLTSTAVVAGEERVPQAVIELLRYQLAGG